ncbi:helix-turn-helix domain-containing protein [Aurantimonas coralicida]|uniref:helix-turn-helix domain-containing protein n=1 Tax=Aurantimonas coralicida TaxID=182270 RepID=UPI00165DDBD8|nr:helix-turn-helix domain-containing protein [Aurantimonas coralicida]MCC4299071.1 TetR/AcrR family transcriptional regulator [Aurantimonas coralicida]
MPEVGRNRIETDEILEAADRIFGRDGLGASMREIAREATVADAVLYRRFPTRDDLVFRLLSDKEANRTASDFIRRKIGTVVTDPKLAERLTPYDHGFATKRPPSTRIISRPSTGIT